MTDTPKQKGTPMRPQSYTKHYRQLRNTESETNSLHQEAAHQYQEVSPETYIQVADKTGQAILRNIYSYTYMHANNNEWKQRT